MNELAKYWPSLVRLTVGLYWLYFASQKWNGVDWMKGVIKGTADANPIPGLHELLENVVVPNWFVFGVAQGIGETLVAVLLIVGLATRWAALLGLLLAANLAFTVAFASGGLVAGGQSGVISASIVGLPWKWFSEFSRSS